MTGAKEIQDRMKSISDTMKITNAMYLISTTKVKKAREALDAAMPHFYASVKFLCKILRDMPELKNIWFGNTEEQQSAVGGKKAYLVISGDKGLAGAYNHNIVKAAAEAFGESDPEVYVVGQMGRASLEKMGYHVHQHFEYVAQSPTVSRARRIAEHMVDRYRRGILSEVNVLFTHSKNGGDPEILVQKILPLDKEYFSVEELEKKGLVDSFIQSDAQTVAYLPSPEAVLDSVVPSFLSGYIYGLLVEAFTSEENARMMAMKNATDNAGEMLRTLSVAYNRVRQAAITQQIVEVAGGAKAQKRKNET